MPFVAAVPWVCVADPQLEDPGVKKQWLEIKPGTGTLSTSNLTSGDSGKGASHFATQAESGGPYPDGAGPKP